MARRWLLWIAAFAAIYFLLIPPLVHGWTHVETDFPNYYTGAKLFRERRPFRDWNDWTTFQRQLNYDGWALQLGGYMPYTPLTALPMAPLAGLPPMTAKRVWLALSVLFLAATIAILARLTHLPVPGLILLALLGHNALAGNLEYGQYYLFLLFTLAVSFWLLLRGREFTAGLILGAMFVLKLYAGPFLLYFAWKRRWRPLTGMLVAVTALALFSVAWFGLPDNLLYVNSILARTVAGENMDPYNPGLPTILNMLRHPFQMEPSLNPHPFMNVPALAFFLQPLVTLSIPVFCVLAIPRNRTIDRTELAWFLIMLVLVSPSRAFYVTVILLLPIALLLENAKPRRTVWLIAAYLLVSVSLPAAWAPFFPTVWILFAAYVTLGIPYWRNLRPAVVVMAAVAIIVASAISAYRRMSSFYREPPQKYERVAFEENAIYSSTPAVSSGGIVFESIAGNRYLLKLWKDGAIETLPFDGHAFHPSVVSGESSIYFELVSGGHSRIMSYNLESKSLQQLVSSGFEPTHPSASPDGQSVAFIGLRRIVIYRGGALGAIDGPMPVHDVAWFPDSARLVYSAGPSGRAQIFATKSGISEQLTHDAGDHAEPAISPDGNRLAYTLSRGATRQIWIQNLATGHASPLTEGNCNSYSPAWEPDSHAIVFACDCQRGMGLPALFRAKL